MSIKRKETRSHHSMRDLPARRHLGKQPPPHDVHGKENTDRVVITASSRKDSHCLLFLLASEPSGALLTRSVSQGRGITLVLKGIDQKSKTTWNTHTIDTGSWGVGQGSGQGLRTSLPTVLLAYSCGLHSRFKRDFPEENLIEIITRRKLNGNHFHVALCLLREKDVMQRSLASPDASHHRHGTPFLPFGQTLINGLTSSRESHY